ncbi:MAG: DUF342 domain-containing protein [Deltaproteobacteria bacterium]|nr:DUF342 domain-containing protein [Deltaproteobacteria bacterium]
MITVLKKPDLSEAVVEIVLEDDADEQLSPAAIKTMLAAEGVSAGLDEPAIEVLCQQAAANPGQKVRGTVAREQPYAATRQPEYKFHFATRNAIGRVLESGRIDYRDRGLVNFHPEGTVLLEIIPGSAGRNGIKIDGSVTEAEPLAPVKKIQAGKNVKVETAGDGRLVYKSTAAGQACLNGTQLAVENLYVVDGDVDLGTGHIKYQGPVQVTGNLTSGLAIYSNNDVFINKLLDGGTVKAKGDLVVGTGIIGGPDTAIFVAGNIKSEYIAGLENCQAKGSIVVEKHIINSRLTAGGAIRCAGKITGECHIASFSGVETGELGSEGSSKITVEVGYDLFIREKLHKIEDIMLPMVERSIEIVDLVGMPAILKKDPALVPAERRENGASLIDEYQQLDAKIGLLKNKKNELEKKIAAARQATVQVHREVLPGVVIKIGREVYQVEKALKGPLVFRLDPAARKITVG